MMTPWTHIQLSSAASENREVGSKKLQRKIRLLWPQTQFRLSSHDRKEMNSALAFFNTTP